MIDFQHQDYLHYQPPALVRIGAIPDIAAELEKLGIDSSKLAYVPGDPVDWSLGRLS